MKEIWKDIVGYEGYYQVSNLGRIRSLDVYVKHNTAGGKQFRKGCVLKQCTDNFGYKMVNLSKDSKTKQYRIHRLVAQAFIPNPNNYNIVNHKDEIPSNNEVSNLEWCTQKYNTNYGTAQQRRAKKLSRPVLQFTKLSEFVAEYPSAREAEIQTGINVSNISECCNGKRNYAGGYIWQYK